MAVAAGKVEPTSKTQRWETDEEELSRYSSVCRLYVRVQNRQKDRERERGRRDREGEKERENKREEGRDSESLEEGL